MKHVIVALFFKSNDMTDIEHYWFWGSAPLICVPREMKKYSRKGGKQGKFKKKKNPQRKYMKKQQAEIMGKAVWEKGVCQIFKEYHVLSKISFWR